MLHVAQWKGVNAVLTANNVTSMEGTRLSLYIHPYAYIHIYTPQPMASVRLGSIHPDTKPNHTTEAKARLPALQADLQAAAAGAGQAVLATALPELTDQWQALFDAQAGDAAGQQAAAVALGTAAGKEVLALRATDGANATGPDYMGACVLTDGGEWMGLIPWPALVIC